MKLLKRTDAAVQAEERKRQQIDEGVTIAKKIDGLRVVLSQLQEQQKVIVQAHKEELQRETAELISQRDSIQGEVNALQVVRDELKRPLDAEWKRVNAEKENNEKKTYELGVLKENLDVRDARIRSAEQEVEEQKEETRKANKEAKQNLLKTQATKLEADKLYKEAQQNAEQVSVQATKRLEEVARKEEQVEFELKGNAHQKQVMDEKYQKWEQELQVKERQLKDREQVLARNIKRNEQQRKA